MPVLDNMCNGESSEGLTESVCFAFCVCTVDHENGCEQDVSNMGFSNLCFAFTVVIITKQAFWQSYMLFNENDAIATQFKELERDDSDCLKYTT